MIGGITWYSTLGYYRLLNEEVNKQMGGVHSARIILTSLDFAAIMCTAAKDLELAGAHCLMIGANTMHNVADEVQAAINIPVIHIVNAVAHEIKQKGLATVALLGTKYTMQMDFYKKRLADDGIQVIIPGETAIEYINDTIYNEFSKGIFLPDKKSRFLQIIKELVDQGAEGVVLGCTEIPIIVKREDCTVPVFDTTYLHVAAAVKFALHKTD